MSVAPAETTMVRGIQRMGTNPPQLDANLIAKGAVLTAGGTSYVLNPTGISCMNIICGTPSIVYTSMSRKGIEITDKKACCGGKHHYQVSKMTGMLALGKQESKAVVGKAAPAKLGLFTKGPYYAVTSTNDKTKAVSLDNDAACLKVVAPAHAAISKACAPTCCGAEGTNCKNLIKGRLIRNVHQPIFNGQTGKNRQQIGIITSSNAMCPKSCCTAAPWRFLHMRVEVTNEEWKKTATEDDYIRLATFLFTTNGGEYTFVDNFLGPAETRLPYTWGVGTGGDFGLNQWVTYSDIKGMIANGVINSGSLLDEIKASIVSAAKAGIDKAKEKMDQAKNLFK